MNKNMKYIKTFEELKPDVYKKAGEKLKKMNHTDRGDNLIKYGLSKNHEKALSVASDMRDLYAKYNLGKIGIHIDWFGDKEDGWDFEGDDKNFDWSFRMLDDITGEEWDKYCDVNLIRCFVSVIPSDEMINYVFNEYERDQREDHEGAVEFIQDEFVNAPMAVMMIDMSFRSELDSKLELVNIAVSDWGEFDNVKFYDRRSANKLKTLMYKIFSNEIDYPAGTHGDFRNKPMYEEIEEMFSELDLLTEYNTEVKDIADQIKAFPTNKLYSQIN